MTLAYNLKHTGYVSIVIIVTFDIMFHKVV